jgi:hypothetical protein
MEEALGLYPTPQPMPVLQLNDNRSQLGQGYAARGYSGQTWGPAGDQQVSIRLLTPMYRVFFGQPIDILLVNKFLVPM